VLRPEPYYENVNNWTILFELSESQFCKKEVATFMVLLAGAKTGTSTLYQSLTIFSADGF
jgi:rhamnogalacturonan endolyase